MRNEIIVALIAFGGVFLSVVFSLITSLRLTKTELQKIRTELLQLYSDKLLDKRLDVYPRLYQLTSDFLKMIEFESEKFTQTKLREFRDELTKWDSEYAIFLSKNAGGKLYDFRKRIIEEFNNKKEGELRSQDLINSLITQVEGLEVALKNDLGVYKVEYLDTDKKFASYREKA